MEQFLLFTGIGFLAQLVDGSIGMAYGLIGTSTLLSVGIPPATASASIHAAEVFTSGASGLSHWRFKNVNWALVRRLVPAGMAGGVIGAFILASYSNPYLSFSIAVYLFAMGWMVFWRSFHNFQEQEHPPRYTPVLGFAGGLLDSVGGGGWGSCVTSHLIRQGTNPRQAIGSASFSEFFVASVVSITFLVTIGLKLWPIITGLVIGGIVGAPVAAYITKKLPMKILIKVVGLMIMTFSLWSGFMYGVKIF